MKSADFRATFPLISGIVRDFAEGNDASTVVSPSIYFAALEDAGLDLAGTEAEAKRIAEEDPFYLEVIIRGILPAEANSYEGPDEEELSERFPLVGSIFTILSDFADSYDVEADYLDADGDYTFTASPKDEGAGVFRNDPYRAPSVRVRVLVPSRAVAESLYARLRDAADEEAEAEAIRSEFPADPDEALRNGTEA